MQAPRKTPLPDCAVPRFCLVLLLLFAFNRFFRHGAGVPHSYVEAFFGPAGRWEDAFERFLRSPPSGSKDRAAMRDVAAFLTTGVDSMCPRGFRALANAAEVREAAAPTWVQGSPAKELHYAMSGEGHGWLGLSICQRGASCCCCGRILWRPLSSAAVLCTVGDTR